MPNSTEDYISDNSWAAIAFCFVLVGLLGSTTFYYWRKYRRISKNMLLTDEVITGDETGTVGRGGGHLLQLL